MDTIGDLHKEVYKLHEKAMELDTKAIVLKHNNGNIEEVNKIYEQACEIEEHAANMLEPINENEPLRSVLYRSASSMAYCSGNHEKALKLIEFGLKGVDIPEEVTKELVGLLFDVSTSIEYKNREENKGNFA